jgi:hypothetical protein
MAANPEPDKAVVTFHSEGPVVRANPRGPEAADLLEAK